MLYWIDGNSQSRNVCRKTLDRMLANLSQDNTLGAFKLISLLGDVASEFTDAENEVSEC